MRKLLGLFLGLTVSGLFACSLPILDKDSSKKAWEKTFGGKYDDGAYAITPTKDGGFIIAGYTSSSEDNKKDIYLVKVDEEGNKVWEKTFGGNNDDEAYAITPTNDGGFIVAGVSYGDSYLLKLNKKGDKIWEKTFAGDKAYAIIPTKDNNFIVAGVGSEDIYLLKIDENGNKLWQKFLGGRDYEEAQAIAPTKDGNFVIIGNIIHHENDKSDIYLIKIDKDGNKIWEKTFGGDDDDDKAYAITPTEDGGFIVAGVTNSFENGGSDVYLIKIDEEGNKVWEKTFGGEYDDGATAIIPTEDGGFIVAGYTKSFGNGGKDIYLIKIDENGDKVWEETFGGKLDDEAKAIASTDDNGIVIAGLTESCGNGKKDMYLIKVK